MIGSFVCGVNVLCRGPLIIYCRGGGGGGGELKNVKGL